MLEIKKAAAAGTMESSDVMILIEPNENHGIEIELDSNVIEIFGEAIEQTIREVLNKFEVKHARITAHDRGALDFAIRARTACAVCRAAEITYDWSEDDGKE